MNRFEVKDSPFLYDFHCLTITNSRILDGGVVCVLKKGFKSKFIENEPKGYSAICTPRTGANFTNLVVIYSSSNIMKTLENVYIRVL